MLKKENQMKKPKLRTKARPPAKKRQSGRLTFKIVPAEAAKPDLITRQEPANELSPQDLSTETGTAFLVDPMGHAPQSLNESEFKELRRLLTILRDEDEKPLGRAIWWLLSGPGKPKMDDRAIFGLMVSHFITENNDNDVGLLAKQFGATESLSDREMEVLQWTLAAYRLGGWFAEWLRIQLCSIACNSTDPKYHHPTPLQIASTLTEFIKEHEDRLNVAREFAQMRPDLLFPAPAEPPATPEPPAVTEAAQPSSKGPTGHPRTRRRGKVAARG
jgi:hypothetical protein